MKGLRFPWTWARAAGEGFAGPLPSALCRRAEERRLSVPLILRASYSSETSVSQPHGSVLAPRPANTPSYSTSRCQVCPTESLDPIPRGPRDRAFTPLGVAAHTSCLRLARNSSLVCERAMRSKRRSVASVGLGELEPIAAIMRRTSQICLRVSSGSSSSSRRVLLR